MFSMSNNPVEPVFREAEPGSPRSGAYDCSSAPDHASQGVARLSTVIKPLAGRKGAPALLSPGRWLDPLGGSQSTPLVIRSKWTDPTR